MNEGEPPTEVLSQEEIDQLLTAINAGDTDPEDFRPHSQTRKIKIHDFRRPDVFSRSDIRLAGMAHDDFVDKLSRNFSSGNDFGSLFKCYIASIDQLTTNEFIRSIPTPTFLAVDKMSLTQNSNEGPVILEIDPAISSAMMDYMAKSPNEYASKVGWSATPLENAIMKGVAERMLTELLFAWRTYFPGTTIVKNPTIFDCPSRIMLAQQEMGLLVTIETKLGDVEGMINLFYPERTLRAMREFTRTYKDSEIFEMITRTMDDKPKLSYMKQVVGTLQTASVELTAELFRKNFTIQQVLDTVSSKGTFYFDKPTNLLRSNEGKLFTFTEIKKGNKKAIRLEEGIHERDTQ